MQCPVCQFENVPGLPRCARCQSALKLGNIPVDPPRARQSPARRRRFYLLARASAEQRARLVAALNRWGVRRPFASADWAGVFWSVLPGLGHIRRGHPRIGRAILGCWAALLLAALLWAGTGWSWFFYATAASVHGSAVAAFLSACLRERRAFQRMFTGLAVFLILYVAAYLPLVRGISTFVRPLQVQGIATGHELRNGDVLLYAGRLLRRGPLERGQLIVYTVRGRLITVRANPDFNILVRSGYWADRIIGLPGDHVEIRQGVLHVNDRPVPPDRGPIGDLQALEDFDLNVPAGTCFVLPTHLLSHIVVPRTVTHRPEAFAHAYSQLTCIGEDEVLGRVLWRTRPVRRFGPVD